MNKTYYRFVGTDDDYFWRGSDGSVLRLAGKPKFILQSLVSKHGQKKGIDIFNKFIDASEDIANLGAQFGDKTATFVLYNIDDDYKYTKNGEKNIQDVQTGKKEYSETGEDSVKKDIQ